MPAKLLLLFLFLIFLKATIAQVRVTMVVKNKGDKIDLCIKLKNQMNMAIKFDTSFYIIKCQYNDTIRYIYGKEFLDPVPIDSNFGNVNPFKSTKFSFNISNYHGKCTTLLGEIHLFTDKQVQMDSGPFNSSLLISATWVKFDIMINSKHKTKEVSEIPLSAFMKDKK